MSNKLPIRDTNLTAVLIQTTLDALTLARQLSDTSLPRPDEEQIKMLEEALDHARLELKEYRRKTTPIALKGQRA